MIPASPTSPPWSIDHVPKDRSPWIPRKPQTHNFIQVVRKHHAQKSKRPSLYSANTWPRSPPNTHNRPELISSNSNSSPLSQDNEEHVATTTTTTLQHHRRSNPTHVEPPSIPSRNPTRISDIQDPKISNAFMTTICCRCFRYITLHPYHYECADEGCKETVCNECIKAHSALGGKTYTVDMLETILNAISYREKWKGMEFLKQFEATGKALDCVCRLYPVKIVQKTKSMKDELNE